MCFIGNCNCRNFFFSRHQKKKNVLKGPTAAWPKTVPWSDCGAFAWPVSRRSPSADQLEPSRPNTNCNNRFFSDILKLKGDTIKRVFSFLVFHISSYNCPVFNFAIYFSSEAMGDSKHIYVCEVVSNLLCGR